MKLIHYTSIIVFFSLLFYQQPNLKKDNPSSNNLKSLINKFESYTASVPIEKVFIHLNKPYYFTGENIWFKAYIVNGYDHIMKPVSKILYTQIYNSKKELIKSIKLQITDGYAVGDFKLDQDLKQGKYLIVAYTNGMRNFDKQFLFHKYIDVFSSIDNNSDTIVNKITPISTDLQFFPEGGSLIENITSQLAFKATDKNGNSINIEGEIYDQNHILHKTFKTSHLGMGKIDFTPKENETYYAIIKSERNKKHYDLPSPLQQGYVLSAYNNEIDRIKIKIQTNTPNNTIWLIGQCRGKVYYAIEVFLNNKNVQFEIPKLKFPSGVIQFTLFDHNKRPFAERLVFVKNEPDLLNISLIPDKENYLPREKVELEIKATDKLGIPQKVNLSLSVNDYFQINQKDNFDNNNIYSYLLLTSELKETIENPDYYFKDNNNESQNSLDILLMTQGWRRFIWQQVLENEKIPWKYPFEKGISLNGKIDHCPKKYSIEENTLNVMLFSNKTFFDVISPSPDSTFTLNLPEFKGEEDLIIQPLDRKGKPVSLDLHVDTSAMLDDLNYSCQLNKNELTEPQLDLQKESEYLDKSFKDLNIALEEVTVTAKRIEKKPETYILTTREGVNIEKADVKYENVAMYFSRLPGVILEPTGGPNFFSFKLFRSTKTFSIGHPLIVIDDLARPTYEGLYIINNINPENVLSINILRGPQASQFGMRGINGVILVYTKKGVNISKRFEDEFKHSSFKITGFYSNREYYCPSYSKPKKEHEKRDIRASIYWNANIQTDENGYAKVTFYNSDRNTRIKAQIQGIGSNGTLGYKELFYDVEEIKE